MTITDPADLIVLEYALDTYLDWINDYALMSDDSENAAYQRTIRSRTITLLKNCRAELPDQGGQQVVIDRMVAEGGAEPTTRRPSLRLIANDKDQDSK